MNETDDQTQTERQRLSRRTVVTGAAWTIPVIALAVAAPSVSASPVPTDISVTLQPTPPVAGRPLRLTYRGTSGFDFVDFPAGTTATVTITGSFTGPTYNGATQTSRTGTNPVVITLAITNLSGFYFQGTGTSGTSIVVEVRDGSDNVIGSDTTTIP